MDRSKQLGEAGVLHLLLSFSIPAITGMLVNALYNVVDRIFVGHGVGSMGIAGITIGFPMMLIMMAFGMLIGIGSTTLVSIRLGQQKKEEAEVILANGFTLLVIISILISVVGLIFLDPMLQFFGASEEVLPFARDYLRIILWGGIFQGIGFGLNNIIRAEGNPKVAMLTMLIGAVINAILNPIFIFIFGWGIKGSATATVISQFITTIWVMAYFLGGRSSLKFRMKNLKLQRKIAASIIAIGSAPFAMQMAASVLNLILNNALMNYGGDIAIAAMGIINSITMLILMPIFGINQGAQPIIGYNYGARKFDRVKLTLKLAAIGATIVTVLGFALTQLFPVQILQLFNRDDVEMIQLGAKAMRIFLLMLPIIGFQIVGANYFQAVGKPKNAMFLSLSRQVLLLIPALLILPNFFGLNGVFYAGPVSDATSSIITAILLFRELNHLDEKHAEVQADLKNA